MFDYRLSPAGATQVFWQPPPTQVDLVHGVKVQAALFELVPHGALCRGMTISNRLKHKRELVLHLVECKPVVPELLWVSMRRNGPKYEVVVIEPPMIIPPNMLVARVGAAIE